MLERLDCTVLKKFMFSRCIRVERKNFFHNYHTHNLLIMKGAARLQWQINFFFFFLITELHEVKVDSQTVISVVKACSFRLSLFCRVGGVADPCATLSFTAAAASIPIWMGRMQRWKQSPLDSVSLRLNGTHAHTRAQPLHVSNTIHFLLSLRGHRYTLHGPLWWYAMWLGST